MNMQLVLLIVFLLSWGLLGVTKPTLRSSYILHEKRSHTPSGWDVLRRRDASSVLPLRFGLKQSSIDKLEDMLYDISHPDSSNYGNHWAPAQVTQTFAPSQETVEIVRGWLEGAGFGFDRVKLAPSRNWLEVNTTVEEAEHLLKTEYHVYGHKSGKIHTACSEYHLPIHVSPHVDLVNPSIHFDAILGKRGSGATPAKTVGLPGVGIFPKTTGNISSILSRLENCDVMITPICLRALYGLNYSPLSTKKNTFGIVEYTPQAYLQSDLDLFFANFSSSLVGKSPEFVSIDGGVIQTMQTGFNFNGESNLDLQYAMNLVNPVGSKQEVVLYQVGDLPQGASFNNFLDALDGSYCTFEGGDDPSQDEIFPDNLPNGYNGAANCGTTKPANVISTSYGYNEADLSPSYTLRQCAEYAKLGLMGVTVLFSSGDNGVAGNGALCLNVDGSQTEDGMIFNPGFPSTCPFVTSVGATQINLGNKYTDPEVACEQVIFSGGGFSNYFGIPDYQKKAVGKYLQDHKPSHFADIWNSTGVSRGYPDISANGANYVVAVDGRFARVFGTSASTPVVGSILAMVNDARLTIGKKPIGFINPAIYSDAFSSAFHDITSGNNQGCNTPGFSAVPGWDPVTGLGTPSFAKLLEKWLTLP